MSKAVTRYNYKEGDRVIRGRDWKWDTQDCDKMGIPSTGTIIHKGLASSSVRVKWDGGHENMYWCEIDGRQDLYFAPPEVALTKAFGYDVSKYRPNHGGFSFGCGEVRVTKEEISGWLKIEDIIKSYELKNEELVKKVMLQLLIQED